ncbi:hypothetical protein FRAAL4605 [Frankia alni ACN14a]|uniref:Uncharacterized protein n=1 Tax=Frankia alni (strain DSM 45986 / CECT 9034 / ACN14a) TaxID=326424 RepID=Q0RGY8_FRAAA|nr:hypothetical protein FRAAL4605 [Frankia alni ACN14a]
MGGHVRSDSSPFPRSPAGVADRVLHMLNV